MLEGNGTSSQKCRMSAAGQCFSARPVRSCERQSPAREKRHSFPGFHDNHDRTALKNIIDLNANNVPQYRKKLFQSITAFLRHLRLSAASGELSNRAYSSHFFQSPSGCQNTTKSNHLGIPYRSFPIKCGCSRLRRCLPGCG
jgi:hypothetical protein